MHIARLCLVALALRSPRALLACRMPPLHHRQRSTGSPGGCGAVSERFWPGTARAMSTASPRTSLRTATDATGAPMSDAATRCFPRCASTAASPAHAHHVRTCTSYLHLHLHLQRCRVLTPSLLHGSGCCGRNTAHYCYHFRLHVFAFSAACVWRSHACSIRPGWAPSFISGKITRNLVTTDQSCCMAADRVR